MTKRDAVFLGSVNRWECDENDHLNVRFFVQKLQQTLELGLLEQGLVTPDQIAQVARAISVTHMRFVAEARLAVALSGYFSLLENTTDGFRALVELRNSATDQVLAAFTYDIKHRLTSDPQSTVDLPAYAGSRGIPDADLSYSAIKLQDCFALGFTTIGRGIIRSDECCNEGYLLSHQYMGRGSDSMPNLWARLNKDNTRGDGELGGAVLEYRMNHYTHLRVGNRYEMVSGIESLGDKTQSMVHLMFSLDNGRMVYGSRAVGINMDLVARKAVSIPADRRCFIEQLLLTAV